MKTSKVDHPALLAARRLGTLVQPGSSVLRRTTGQSRTRLADGVRYEWQLAARRQTGLRLRTI